MSGTVPSLEAPELFERIAMACAVAQRSARDAQDAVHRARATRANSRRLRALAAETREAWTDVSEGLAELRAHVARITRSFQESAVRNAPLLRRSRPIFVERSRDAWCRKLSARRS